MDKLNKLREEINSIDLEIISLIKKRLDVVKKVGKIKKESNLPIKNPARERELITLLTNQARKAKIPQELIKIIWKEFFKIAYKVEKV